MCVCDCVCVDQCVEVVRKEKGLMVVRIFQITSNES